jgi:OmpA-OmpF porin, OOP family
MTANRSRLGGAALVIAVAASLVVVHPELARGQAAAPSDRSFNPQLFHPAPGPDEFITVEPAMPLRHKRYGLGLFFNYARDQFTIFRYDPVKKTESGPLAHLIEHAVAMDVWAAFGLFNRFQLAIAWPMTLYQSGQNFNDFNPGTTGGTHITAPSGFALGDPRLHLKARILGKDLGPQVALSYWQGFPLGNDTNFGGEAHFGGFTGEARALGGWEGERWHLGVFVGVLWRAHTSHFFSTTVGPASMTYGGAFAFDAVVQRLTLVAEVYAHNDFSLHLNANPLEWDAAAKIRVIYGLSLNVGVGSGIIAGLGSSNPRVFVGGVWAPSFSDKDKDGIPDQVDLCPDEPEDKDGFRDNDGCPDPDNDGDGIEDTRDKCPNKAEDFDQFQDDDGCPEPDNDNDGVDDLHDPCPNDAEDHKPPKPDDGCPATKTDSDGDGVPDAVDKCPKDAEDKDGFEDADGCPDPDNDGDGIPDNFDQCPNDAEDLDGFEDDDGCPDLDNDRDGVPDKLDKCPNEPETINGFQDEDGCPDAGPPSKVKLDPVKKQIVILDKIFFDTGKATIKPVSFGLLDQVAQLLRGHAEIKIEIQGHTDAQGDMDTNIKLSKERAESVRTYLIKKGVAPAHMVSGGYGPTQPIANNKTKAGREANRRVEFHITDDGSKAKPQDEAPSSDPKQSDTKEQ